MNRLVWFKCPGQTYRSCPNKRQVSCANHSLKRISIHKVQKSPKNKTVYSSLGGETTIETLVSGFGNTPICSTFCSCNLACANRQLQIYENGLCGSFAGENKSYSFCARTCDWGDVKTNKHSQLSYPSPHTHVVELHV